MPYLHVSDSHSVYAASIIHVCVCCRRDFMLALEIGLDIHCKDNYFNDTLIVKHCPFHHTSTGLYFIKNSEEGTCKKVFLLV